MLPGSTELYSMKPGIQPGTYISLAWTSIFSAIFSSSQLSEGPSDLFENKKLKILSCKVALWQITSISFYS